MRERLPLYLVLAGTVTVLAGSILTVILLVRRNGCDGVETGCQGYTNSIHWTFPLILLGSSVLHRRGTFRGQPRAAAPRRHR